MAWVWPPVRAATAPGATSYSASNQLAAVFVQEPSGRSAEARPGPTAAWRCGRNRATPGTRPRPLPGGPAGPHAADLHLVDEQPANVVHVHVGKHHVGHGCEIDAGCLQSSTSAGRDMSSSQAARTAGSALVAKIGAGVGSTPLTRCFSRQSYFTGVRTGASLSLSKTTKNLAGIVVLALRPTV